MECIDREERKKRELAVKQELNNTIHCAQNLFSVLFYCYLRCASVCVSLNTCLYACICVCCGIQFDMFYFAFFSLRFVSAWSFTHSFNSSSVSLECGLLILRLWQVATKNDFSQTTNSLTINNVHLHAHTHTSQQSLSLSHSLSLSLSMFVCIKECEVALTHFRICFLLCDTWVVSAQASERARIKHCESNKSCWLMFISVCVSVSVSVCIVWIRLRECIKFNECLCWQSYSTLLIVCMRFSLFFQFRIPFVHFLLSCPFMLLWPVSFTFYHSFILLNRRRFIIHIKQFQYTGTLKYTSVHVTA